jgi:hypothetical protein
MPDDDAKDVRLSAGELIASLRSNTALLRLSFEQHTEALRESAKLYYARYESLLEAGFSAEQALTIIVQRGLA